MNPFSEALEFTIRTLFGIAASVFLIRLLMQGLRVDFRNPICQATYRFTNPVLQPLKPVLPTLRSWNLAALVLMYLILLLGDWLAFLVVGVRLGWAPILLWSLGSMVAMIVWSLIGMILIRVIASYLSVDAYNPLLNLLRALTEPLLRPFRRVIPPLAGFDLSPVFAALLLQIIWILVGKPLKAYALTLYSAGLL